MPLSVVYDFFTSNNYTALVMTNIAAIFRLQMFVMLLTSIIIQESVKSDQVKNLHLSLGLCITWFLGVEISIEFILMSKVKNKKLYFHLPHCMCSICNLYLYMYIYMYIRYELSV